MGIPLFDLMNYGMGLAEIASAPARQAFLLAQGVAGLGLDDALHEAEPDAVAASPSAVVEPAARERAAA